MQIQKLTRTFYNRTTKELEESQIYRVSYKTIMVLEEDLKTAIAKIIMHARYVGVLKLTNIK